MTLARRICAIVDVDLDGKSRGSRIRSVDKEDAVASAIALFEAGADEIWIRLADGNPRATPLLFDALRALRGRVFVPVVAWAPVQGVADARLLEGLGADRVVIDLARSDDVEPLEHVARVVDAVGVDRVSVALSVRRVAAEKGVAWELLDAQGGGTGRDAIDLVRGLPEAGAAEVVLVPRVGSQAGGDPFVSPAVVHDGDLVEAVSSWLWVPVVSVADDRDPADMVPALLMGADGVASPRFSATGSVTVADLKRALTTYGCAVRNS